MQIYLVPGFFGFTSLGAINYFHRVAETLEGALRTRGHRADIIECGTQPTGSIRTRADRLLERVLECGGDKADSIHFVGHSTGGLDIRLLTTPGVKLRPGDEEEQILTRTKSVITLATPHYGTPLAGFFTTVLGRQLMGALTALATTEAGRMSVYAASQLLARAAKLDDALGRKDTFLDSWARRLLGRVTLSENDEVYNFLRDISSDQGAMVQLMPESMHLYNAAVTDAPNVRYSSAVTCAPPPSVRTGLRTPATYAVYSLLYALTARVHPHYPYPHPGPEILGPFADAHPYPIDSQSNDGIVPTLSQVHGQVLSLVNGDHLDVVGQFSGATGSKHDDWLPCGAGFGPQTFESLWSRVAQEIDEAEQSQGAAESA